MNIRFMELQYWLSRNHPKVLQDWIVENERRQVELRTSFSKKFEKVQYFLDNNTDDDATTLELKKAMQIALDMAKNEDNPNKRESIWYSVRSLGAIIT